MRLFLWSLVGVLSQLAFVRIFSTLAGATAYYGNVILLVGVFGLGAGFFASKLAKHGAWIPAFALLAFETAVWLGGYNLVQVLPAEFQWQSIANIRPKEVDIDLHLAVLLLCLTILPAMLLVGARQGAEFVGRNYRGRGYLLMTAGGLAGGMLFAVQNQFAPDLIYLILLWSLLVAFLLLAESQSLIGKVAVGALLALLIARGAAVSASSYWSPYQRITAERASNDELYFFVNGFFIQSAWTKPAAGFTDEERARFAPAFRAVRPGSRVLVLGSGTGTRDVREAVHAGAARVVAVEIDPRFVEFGRRIDPDHTYDRENVSVVVEDARRYVSSSTEKFDVVVLNFLDSQTNASAHARFRLDSFLYTAEGLRAAWNLVDKDGVFLLQFATGNDWIARRMRDTLKEGTGANVRMFRERGAVQSLFVVSRGRDLSFLPPQIPEVPEAASRGISRLVNSDDWPFLYSRERKIPTEHLRLILSLVFLLAATGLLAARFQSDSPGGVGSTPFNIYAAFSGAAFFFIEIRTISALVPIVGTTYLAQAGVVMAILLVSLGGAFAASASRTLEPRIVWLLLAASLPLSSAAEIWFHPLYGTTARSLPLLIAGLLLPVLIAGYLYLLYAKQLDSATILSMQRWNLFGGVLGGFAECSVVVWGFHRSLLVAAAFYALALAPLVVTRLFPAPARTGPGEASASGV
jgi:predicted membrane-bound spermidine synthase